MSVERVALEDEGVKAEIAKLKLPEGSVVVVDPWIYGEHSLHAPFLKICSDTASGADGVNDDDRMWQCLLYMRDPANPEDPDSCHYAFPLAISPVVRSDLMKVSRIDFLPTGLDNTINETTPWQPKPANEYVSDYQQLRTDLKPLNVIQPEGASFSVTEQGTSHVLAWQKWNFRVGFNQREGMVLYDVSPSIPLEYLNYVDEFRSGMTADPFSTDCPCPT